MTFLLIRLVKELVYVGRITPVQLLFSGLISLMRVKAQDQNFRILNFKQWKWSFDHFVATAYSLYSSFYICMYFLTMFFCFLFILNYYTVTRQYISSILLFGLKLLIRVEILVRKQMLIKRNSSNYL